MAEVASVVLMYTWPPISSLPLTSEAYVIFSSLWNFSQGKATAHFLFRVLLYKGEDSSVAGLTLDTELVFVLGFLAIEIKAGQRTDS